MRVDKDIAANPYLLIWANPEAGFQIVEMATSDKEIATLAKGREGSLYLAKATTELTSRPPKRATENVVVRRTLNPKPRKSPTKPATKAKK